MGDITLDSILKEAFMGPLEKMQKIKEMEAEANRNLQEAKHALDKILKRNANDEEIDGKNWTRNLEKYKASDDMLYEVKRLKREFVKEYGNILSKDNLVLADVAR